MSRKNPQSVAAREGEGVQLIVHRGPVTAGGLQEMGIDLSRAPVPDRRYTADVVSVIATSEYVHLLFGQSKVVGNQLRSLLDVHFPSAAVRRLLSTINGIEDTFKYLRESGLVLPGELVNIDDEPSQTIGLTANLAMIACSEREACMDLYHVSSFAIAAAERGASLCADKVVRIALPTSLLMALIDKLESIKDTLPEMVGEN